MKVLLWSDIHMGYSKKTYKIYDKFITNHLLKEDFDIILLGGDLISSKQKSLISLFKLLRKHFPIKRICWVRGNHDFWNHGRNRKTLTYKLMMEYHKKISMDYDIYMLENNPLKIDNYVFFGFDGWYAYDPMTNDSLYMNKAAVNGLEIQQYLRSKAHNELNNILAEAESLSEDKIRICLTHFPPYTRNPAYKDMIANESYLGYICDVMDFLFVGHSHKDEDWFFRKARIINSGNDYDKPKCKIIDLSDKNSKAKTIIQIQKNNSASPDKI